MLGKTIRVPRHSELSEPGWRRTGPPLTSSFSPKLILRWWLERAVPGFSYRKCLKFASPNCILLCASTKMQLFLRGRHRTALFSGCGAVGSLLEGENNHAQHFVPRCGFAGPDFELPSRLMDEHFDSGDDLRSPFPGQFQETFRRPEIDALCPSHRNRIDLGLCRPLKQCVLPGEIDDLSARHRGVGSNRSH